MAEEPAVMYEQIAIVCLAALEDPYLLAVRIEDLHPLGKGVAPDCAVEFWLLAILSPRFLSSLACKSVRVCSDSCLVCGDAPV